MDNNFLEAINEKRIVSVTFNSKEKGVVTRRCIPFDFGPSKRYKDGKDRYHFYDLDSPKGNHNLSILPEQIIKIEKQVDTFAPATYVKWSPSWFVKRDWGVYS